MLRSISCTLAGLAALVLPPTSGAQKEGENGTVAGKVTYLGKPLKGGLVEFVSRRNKIVRAKIAEDGTYRMTNVPPQQYRIAVETDSVKPGPGQPGNGKYVKIPEKYGNWLKSGLTVEVKPGKQTHDIALK
jgi:hypothetical protein